MSAICIPQHAWNQDFAESGLENASLQTAIGYAKSLFWNIFGRKFLVLKILHAGGGGCRRRWAQLN
jgi:hypothetical protein